MMIIFIFVGGLGVQVELTLPNPTKRELRENSFSELKQIIPNNKKRGYISFSLLLFF